VCRSRESSGVSLWAPTLCRSAGLDIERPELVDTDDGLGIVGGGLGEPICDRVQLEDPVFLSLELGVVRSLPGSQGLKADAFLAQKLPEPLVGDVRHHLLSDQVVGQLGQAPGRERLPEIGRDAQRDPLDLLPLRQGERARPTAAVAYAFWLR
jgi:hypothetical protein